MRDITQRELDELIHKAINSKNKIEDYWEPKLFFSHLPKEVPLSYQYHQRDDENPPTIRYTLYLSKLLQKEGYFPRLLSRYYEPYDFSKPVSISKQDCLDKAKFVKLADLKEEVIDSILYGEYKVTIDILETMLEGDIFNRKEMQALYEEASNPYDLIILRHDPSLDPERDELLYNLRTKTFRT